jgi:hypothetical protein
LNCSKHGNKKVEFQIIFDRKRQNKRKEAVCVPIVPPKRIIHMRVCARGQLKKIFTVMLYRGVRVNGSEFARKDRQRERGIV